MPTPDLPAFRPRLAACRLSASRQVRRASLAELEHFLQGIFPPHLLAQQAAGDNSRDPSFSLCLTRQCFLWQVLNPKAACREVVRQLRQELHQGDILPGYRAYEESTTLATFPQRGVDVVARLHQARRVDFRRAQRLSRNDGLFVWKKNLLRSKLLTGAQWRQVPDSITVRLLRFTAAIRGFRSRRITLVTTLLDPKLYPAEQLIGLYARRWRLELCLRDLKTTLGMEQRRCQTPDRAEKQLLIYLIAHNLVRCLMAEAVARYQSVLERMGLKGTVDALRQYSAAIASARSRKMRELLWQDLLLNLVRDLVPFRPDRLEPRALKRRPKNFGWLTKPRRKFKESFQRNRYWKANPRDYRALN